MSRMTVSEMSLMGLYVGGGITVVPAGITLLIASSRIILVNILANVILRVMTGGQLGIEIYGSLIKVPFLWKISKISAIVGTGIVALSLVAGLVNLIYLRVYKNPTPLRTQMRRCTNNIKQLVGL